MLLGIGKVPGLIAVVICAIPPMIRLTGLGIRLVDKDVLEAADAFGSSSWQKLRNVQLPLALPTIMAGINQTIMMALAMVVIASMIGMQGLGQPVLQLEGVPALRHKARGRPSECISASLRASDPSITSVWMPSHDWCRARTTQPDPGQPASRSAKRAR